jgi:hypothetical protein
MRTRFVFVWGALFVFSASVARAQGTQIHKVAVSQAAMKAMVAHKPKSKTTFTSRVGMIRRSSVVAARPMQRQPTSVRELTPVSKRK